jgi:hypothetical protein
MQYLCLKGVVTSNGTVEAGEICGPLPEFEARVLISQGKIIPYDEPEEVVARGPVVEHRDPRPRGRPRKS